MPDLTIKFEWNDDYGDIAPRDTKLEALLFSATQRPLKGINFQEFRSLPRVCLTRFRYSKIKVELESTEESNFHAIQSFQDASLHPVILDNVKLCGYDEPTPVQKYSIPCILSGADLLAGAQTGSGKTAAFLIPVLSKLMGKATKIAQPRRLGVPQKRAEPLVLIIGPTRELVTQIFDESRRFCYRSMLRPCVVYGGSDTRSQIAELQKGCDVLVATPGRLSDFATRGIISFKRIRHVILDEADRMLDMGFLPTIEALLSKSGIE